MTPHLSNTIPADVAPDAWVLFRLGSNGVYGPERASSLDWARGHPGSISHYQVLVPRLDDDPRKAFEADARTYGLPLERHRESDLYVVHYTELRWQGFLAAWRHRT